jgi:hypothetical protein
VLPKCLLRALHFASHLRAPFGARGVRNFVSSRDREDSPRRVERLVIMKGQTHALRALRAIALRDVPPRSLRSERGTRGQSSAASAAHRLHTCCVSRKKPGKKAESGTPKGVLARRRLSEARLRAGRAEDRGGGSCAPSRASFPPSWPSCGGPLGGRAMGGLSVSRRRAPIFPFSLLYWGYGGGAPVVSS